MMMMMKLRLPAAAAAAAEENWTPMILTPAFSTAVLSAGAHAMVCVVSSEEQLMVVFLTSGAHRDANTTLGD